MAALLFFLVAICSFLSLVGASPVFGGFSNSDSFTIPAQRNPNYAPNGIAAYSRALSKWGATVPEKLQRTQNKGEIGLVAAKPMASDREYLCPVGVGTPPQTLIVDIDTGSSDFWVYSSDSNDFELYNRTLYLPENSTTAIPVTNATWAVRYGDGSYARGVVWKDTITVGGIPVLNATVESAVEISLSMLDDRDMGGIFGVAYTLPNQVQPPQPNVLSGLSPLLKQNVFTVDLKYHAEGLYTFGTINKTAYRGDIRWVPLRENASFWEFDFTGMMVGTKNVWYLSSWTAIADTGTTLILVGEDLVDLYYQQVPYAAADQELGGLYTYPCNITLPDLHFDFAGWNIVIPGIYMNYTTVDTDSGTRCMGGIQSKGDQSQAILGDIFLKALFAVFDIDGGRLGFARKDLFVPGRRRLGGM